MNLSALEIEEKIIGGLEKNSDTSTSMFNNKEWIIFIDLREYFLANYCKVSWIAIISWFRYAAYAIWATLPGR